MKKNYSFFPNWLHTNSETMVPFLETPQNHKTRTTHANHASDISCKSKHFVQNCFKSSKNSMHFLHMTLRTNIKWLTTYTPNYIWMWKI